MTRSINDGLTGISRWVWLLLIWACVGNAGAVEREVIPDNDFRRGFILWEPKPGKHVKYGEIRGQEEQAKPVWGLSQWSSRFPIQPEDQISDQGSLVFSNAAKVITLQPPEADLALAIHSGVEYGPGSRKAGEPWVHLLVEQDFENPPFLNTVSDAHFHLEARLVRSTNLHRGDYDPGVHAAQFQVFFTLQNRNRQSAGYGDLLWFGIPVYDNRHAHPSEFKSKDFGGTEKYIFTPAATNFTQDSTHGGDWVVIDRDLLPLMRESLETAWERGFLAGSKNFADYAIGGMNMGWELPGMFDVAIETRKLSLKVRETAGEATFQMNVVEGWRVLVNQRLLAENRAATEKALELLGVQLREIKTKLPSEAVEKLQQVALWFSPEYPHVMPKAEYHPGAAWLREHHRNEEMVQAVEFTNIARFEAETSRMPNFTLHELAHAYHDQFLPGGFQNPQIKAAYERAKASGSYEEVERRNGSGRPNTKDRAYAMSNPMEYFAELTEAFFSRNDFYPFTREELHQHDLQMEKLLAKLWGVEE